MDRSIMKRKVAVVGILALALFSVLGCDSGLKDSDFTRVAVGGVDDRLNSYPWAMEQFDGDNDGTPEIYVGTINNALCLQTPGMFWLDYIPLYDYLPPERWGCRNDLYGPGLWEEYYEATWGPARIFRGVPGERGESWNWELTWEPDLDTEVSGFRGARVFNGALYMLSQHVDGPFVWKSVDGENFVKASPPGMAHFPGLQASGLRGAQVFDGHLYVTSDQASAIYCSAEPSTDPASWQQANSTGFVASGGGSHPEVFVTGRVTSATADTLTDDTRTWAFNLYAGKFVRITSGTGVGQELGILSHDYTTLMLDGTWGILPDETSTYDIWNPAELDNRAIWQMAVFNDHLYAITFNFWTGPEVWKSADPAPGNWTRVLYGGAGETDIGFMTIRPFGEHVYIGTFTYPPLFLAGAGLQGCEILRLDADDNLELVVGNPRRCGTEQHWLRPISGLWNGFGRTSNLYSWYMGDYDGWFYVGTCDFGSLVYDSMDDSFPEGMTPLGREIFELAFGRPGFDLWRTRDGVEWVKVSDTGFGDHDNFGIRNLMTTQWGFVLGAANPVDGFEIWIGKKRE